ncbi:MAG: heavy metal-binding domain-containing protein [Candidatus Thermoplasmatota archaeon]|nr:heavy metal-binding domain-containing protein [Candidatus Thermoplasmatota archaeon]MEE2625814.1 heavy metal-binding domain-containing protein [Candidatus Thermoplasmatota archaeon]|tara:strand:- start:277 stop:906 length:630 start_codon:yes stop_codon:yes gene_type:complete
MKTSIANFRLFSILAIIAFVTFSFNVVAQGGGGEDEGLPLALIFLLPFILLSVFGIVWMILWPAMFVWGAVFSGTKVERMHEEANQRRDSLRDRMGREILNSIDGGYRTDVSSAGLVHANGVFGPSHWHLMIGFVNNLIGGSVTVFQQVISAGRAEVMQRLREQAEEDGWDEVINVRIDTASMTPQSSNSRNTVRGVEIYAYGTGIKYE